MANYDISKMEDLTVTLTLDDDTELECAVITIFEADGHDYIALLPLEGEDFEDGSVYLYQNFKISKPTKNTILYPMHSMNGLTHRNTMKLWMKKISKMTLKMTSTKNNSKSSTSCFSHLKWRIFYL